MNYSWDLLTVQKDILDNTKPHISNKAYIEKKCRNRRKCTIERGAKILSGARIKGPVYIGENVEINWKQRLIRGSTSIAKDSIVGFCGEVKNSLITERFWAGPLTFVADSLIDHDCFFGGMVRISNYRLDGKKCGCQN